MKFAHSVRTILFASAALVALPAMPALAQGGASEDDSGDIIVTARRREESLNDVPVAITAYSAEALAQSGAIDITSLSDTTPNVTLENSRGTNSTLTAFIRGVGQQDPVSGFEAGVGIYVDDVYLNRPQAAVLDIYDVERIEVLRGPQGTLYGRNTIGGAVKYVTKRLPDQVRATARATYGSYNQTDGVLSLSAPLHEKLRVGAAIARLTRGGFGDNLTLAGVENYNKNVWAGRGTLELGESDDSFLIRVSGDYTRDKSDPRNGHRLIAGLQSGAPVLPNVYDTRAGLNNPKQDVKAYGMAMNVTASLKDALTLRSISAWRRDRSFTPIDFDSLPSIDVDVPALYKNEQISQELQLVYEGEKLKGLVGFYYLDAKSSTQFDVILGTTGTLLSLPGLNAYTEGDVRTSTWSAFGDFTYDLSDMIAVSVGGRYTSDKRRSKILRQTKIGGTSPLFGGTAVSIATITNFEGRAKFTDFNPRASLSFKPSDDHLLYASYAQGFKGGGFDPRGDSRIAPDTDRNGLRSYAEIYDFFLFDPESVNSYELGWKGGLGALNMAVTGFYGDYKNVQIPGSVGVDANGDGIFESFAGVTTNAAKARFKGVEAEANARFARGFAGEGSLLNIAATLGFIDGAYNRYIVNGVDVSGLRRIQNTPKWTTSATLGARLPLASGALNASTTLSYRSKTNQFETPSPFLDQKGYALFDANLVWSSENDRFSLGIHGKNLANKRYITSGYQFLSAQTDGTINRTGAGNVIPALGREGIATAFYGNPRQVFVTAGVKF
jgi:iron complex outermembrane recepter protein